MELAIALLAAFILALVGINIGLKDRIAKLTFLVERLYKNQNGEDAFVVLSWYVKKSAAMGFKTKQHQDALKWFHDNVRLGTLPPEIFTMTYQEFMEHMVEKQKIFSVNWYDREKITGDGIITLSQAMRELGRLKKQSL